VISPSNSGVSISLWRQMQSPWIARTPRELTATAARIFKLRPMAAAALSHCARPSRSTSPCSAHPTRRDPLPGVQSALQLQVLRRGRDVSTKKRRRCERDELMEKRGLRPGFDVGHHPVRAEPRLHAENELDAHRSKCHDNALHVVSQLRDIRTVETTSHSARGPSYHTSRRGRLGDHHTPDDWPWRTTSTGG
jgi:hypothetical protein